MQKATIAHIHPFIHPSIRPSSISEYLSIHPSSIYICLSICPSTHLYLSSIYLFFIGHILGGWFYQLCPCSSSSHLYWGSLSPQQAVSPAGRALGPGALPEPWGPAGPALTGEEELEPGPQWWPARHSPWGSARPSLPQKVPGRHGWQSSTRAAPGASRKVPWAERRTLARRRPWRPAWGPLCPRPDRRLGWGRGLLRSAASKSLSPPQRKGRLELVPIHGRCQQHWPGRRGHQVI